MPRQKKETKNDRFKRVAQRRVVKAAEAIRAVGRIAGHSYYQATTEQINAIEHHLQVELEAAMMKLRTDGRTFTLDEEEIQ